MCLYCDIINFPVAHNIHFVEFGTNKNNIALAFVSIVQNCLNKRFVIRGQELPFELVWLIIITTTSIMLKWKNVVDCTIGLENCL